MAADADWAMSWRGGGEGGMVGRGVVGKGMVQGVGGWVKEGMGRCGGGGMMCYEVGVMIDK